MGHYVPILSAIGLSDVFFSIRLKLGKGSKKRKKIWKIPLWGLDAPLEVEKIKVIFSETRPFFGHFL